MEIIPRGFHIAGFNFNPLHPQPPIIRAKHWVHPPLSLKITNPQCFSPTAQPLFPTLCVFSFKTLRLLRLKSFFPLRHPHLIAWAGLEPTPTASPLRPKSFSYPTPHSSPCNHPGNATHTNNTSSTPHKYPKSPTGCVYPWQGCPPPPSYTNPGCWCQIW